MQQQGKDIALEAFRGLAAVVVLASHIAVGFFPKQSGVFPQFGPGLSELPFFGLLNGEAAVVFFFVLSGFVLTRAFLLRGGYEVIVRGVLKRWPRLVGPVLAVTLLSWLLFQVDAYFFSEAAALIGSPWLGTFANAYPDGNAFTPTLASAVAQGLLTFFRGDHYYDTSLWTMKYEFIGSFVAFGLAALVFQTRGRLCATLFALGLIALLCSFQSPYLVAFPVGVALANSLPERRGNASGYLGALMVGFSVYLWGFTEKAGGFYATISHIIPSDVPANYVHMLGAILMILAVEISLPTHRFLTKPLFAFLGELSFPLYLVHVLILCSAGSFVFVVAPPILAGPLATVATVAGSFLAAYPLVVFNRHWVSWVNRTVRLIYPIPADIPQIGGKRYESVS